MNGVSFVLLPSTSHFSAERKKCTRSDTDIYVCVCVLYAVSYGSNSIFMPIVFFINISTKIHGFVYLFKKTFVKYNVEL